MRDPYAVLGIKRDANATQIKAAWRERVKETHPDRNVGDPDAASRFAEVGRAYDVLKDPRRRELFDMVRKASDSRNPSEAKEQRRSSAANEATARAKAADAVMEEIAEAARQKEQASSDGQPQASTAADSAEDMLERIFGVKAKAAGDNAQSNTHTESEIKAAASSYGPQAVQFLVSLFKKLRGSAELPEKAPDMLAEAMVSPEDILKQKWVTVQLSDEREIRLQIEAGATDGHIMRVKGQGLRLPDMQRGDVLVRISVARNGPFYVQGHDIHTSLPIKLEDAVLGCETIVRLPQGDEHITIPPWSGSDQSIRLEGKGLARPDGTYGDFVIELRVILLEKPDDKVTDLMRHKREGLYL